MLDVGNRAFGQGQRVRDTAQVARHQHHVGGFNRHIRTRTDSEAYIGLSQRGRVVDAVPDERDLTALLETFDRSDLAVGQHFGDHLVDTEFSGDGVRGAGIVPGNHRYPQPEPVKRADSLRRRRLDGIGDRNNGGELPIHGGVKRRFAFVGQPSGLTPEGCYLEPQTGHVAVRADLHELAGYVSLHPVTGNRVEIFGRRQRQPIGLGCLHNRLGDRVFGVSLDRCDQRQQLTFVETGLNPEIGEFGATLGQRAGLVERDDVDLLKTLQRAAVPKQHTQLGSFAGPDHDRGRRRQTHRAGAGDNQHRHGVDQRKRQRGLGSE